MPASVVAQQGAPSAELKRVVGRVEVLAKGQTQWIPGGGPEPDWPRETTSGPTREPRPRWRYPDASTVVVAENSRLLLTKIEYDPRARAG